MIVQLEKETLPRKDLLWILILNHINKRKTLCQSLLLLCIVAVKATKIFDVHQGRLWFVTSSETGILCVSNMQAGEFFYTGNTQTYKLSYLLKNK